VKEHGAQRRNRPERRAHVPARVGWNEDRMTVAGRGKAQEQGGGAHLSIGLTDGYRLDFEKIISINIYRYVRELAWGSMIEAKNVMVAMDDGQWWRSCDGVIWRKQNSNNIKEAERTGMREKRGKKGKGGRKEIHPSRKLAHIEV
jgi:hypothetical protein